MLRGGKILLARVVPKFVILPIFLLAMPVT
jgi:hypothetical protein